MKNKHNLVVGQIIWAVPIKGSNSYRRSKEIKQVTIDTIGNKYFTAKSIGGGMYKFYIESLIQNCGAYSGEYKGFITEKKAIDESEKDELKITAALLVQKLSCDQLRELINTYSPI